MAKGTREHILFETRAAWRAWLRQHHRQSEGIWLVTWKKASGQPKLPYDAIVEEALCFGWIDSKVGRVDKHKSKLLMTPRKPGSGWSRPNKERVATMEKQRKMRAAGRAIIDAAKRDGSWTKLDAIENLEVPADLDAAFKAYPGSRDHWEAFPRSVKRGILEWISTAKRAPTREKRIDETANLAQKNERANQWPRK